MWLSYYLLIDTELDGLLSRTIGEEEIEIEMEIGKEGIEEKV